MSCTLDLLDFLNLNARREKSFLEKMKLLCPWSQYLSSFSKKFWPHFMCFKYSVSFGGPLTNITIMQLPSAWHQSYPLQQLSIKLEKISTVFGIRLWAAKLSQNWNPITALKRSMKESLINFLRDALKNTIYYDIDSNSFATYPPYLIMTYI